MAVPSVMSDLSTTVSSNSPGGGEAPNSTDDFHRAIQAILRHTNAKGADIASATTTNIGEATGEFIDISGTTTITGLGTIAAGIVRTVRFLGALTLTHNATSLILPTAANITTAANDVAVFRSLGSGNWQCVSYSKATGVPATTAYVDAADTVIKAGIQNQTYTRATTTGSGSVYVLAVSPVPSTLAGLKVKAILHADPSGSPTVNINSLGAKNLKYLDSTGTKQFVTTTQAKSGHLAEIEYDGTDVLLKNPLPPYASVLETSQATTSGTSKDFTGIPSWVKTITLNLYGVSTNGTSILLVQLGDSGGIETSGYNCTSMASSSGGNGIVNNTSGITLSGNNSAASIYSGSVVIAKVDGNKYSINSGGKQITTQVGVGFGDKELSDTLTQIRLTTVNGTDTFDAGTINISYE